MKAKTKSSSSNAASAPTTRTADSLSAIQIEDIDVLVSKALGVALLLNESASGDKHNAAAAGAIVDQLTAAKRLLAGEDAHHG